MKKQLLILVVVLFIRPALLAQGNTMLFNEFQNKDYAAFSAKAQGILNNAVLPYADEFTLVQIDSDVLRKKVKTIQLSSSIDIKLTLDSFEEINGRTKIRYKTKGDGALLLSVLDGDIVGYLYSADAVYSIKSLGNGYQAIYMVQSKYYPKGCSQLPVEGVGLPKVLPNMDDLIGTKNIECKLRVLVFYTPAAAALVGNIRNTTELAIDVTNESFVNSGIMHEVELTYLNETNYNETDIESDLTRFWASWDVHMEDVHQLRHRYGADVCVLLADGSNYLAHGLARGIYTDKDHVFCVSSITAAVDNLTFPHEIGHLLGARHNTDNVNTPFAEGHGFKDGNNGFRTIMGIFTSSNDETVRVPYWSNPDVLFNGHPTGVAGTSDNEQVLNATIYDARTFVSPLPDVEIAGDFANHLDFRDAVASNRVYTVGNVDLHSGSKVFYRAVNKVELYPGFVANNGAYFVASAEPIDYCPGNPNAGGKDNGGQLDGKKYYTEPLPNGNITQQIKLYPNPNSGSFTIEGINIRAIDVYDALGGLTRQIRPTSNRVVLDDLASGVYIIRVHHTDGSSSTERVVVF